MAQLKRTTFEELMFAVHNHGQAQGPPGKAWDAGATRRIAELFGPVVDTIYPEDWRSGYGTAGELYDECNSKPDPEAWARDEIRRLLN